MKKIQNKKGFTLIELVVSIAILEIISIPIFGLFAVSMRNNVNSRSGISAWAAAQSFMEYYKCNINQDLNVGPVVYYYLYSNNDISKIHDGLKEDNKSEPLNLNTDESYSYICDNRFDSVIISDYDYAIKVILQKKDNDALKINIIVWDIRLKGAQKVSIVSLRSLL